MLNSEQLSTDNQRNLNSPPLAETVSIYQTPPEITQIFAFGVPLDSTSLEGFDGTLVGWRQEKAPGGLMSLIQDPTSKIRGRLLNATPEDKALVDMYGRLSEFRRVQVFVNLDCGLHAIPYVFQWSGHSSRN